MKTSKRVIVISDLHCGHRVGMTPPEWQLNKDNDLDAKWQAIQAEQWHWYAALAKSLQPVHLLLVLGDAVDGTSSKADRRDCIRDQRREQVSMATTCIDLWKAKHVEMVYGTRYHCADWENDVALNCNATIGAHGWPTVNDVVFDVKHKVGSSSASESTRFTAIARSEQWNSLWAEAGRQPKGDIILRGHVHYHRAAKRKIGARTTWGITCPALQGVGTEYGAEQCEGTVDFGLLVFDIDGDGTVNWWDEMAVLPSQLAVTTKY